MAENRQQPHESACNRFLRKGDFMADNWLVSLPLDELVKLKQQQELFDEMKKENAQLRRELDALRNLYAEMIQQFGDIKRELRKG